MSRTDRLAAHLDPEGAGPPLPAAEAQLVDRVRDVLASPDTWTEPPPDFTAQLLARAAADPTPATPPADLLADLARLTATHPSRPASDVPTADRPTGARSAPGRPAVDQSAPGGPAGDRSAPGRPAVDRPVSGLPSRDRSASDLPSAPAHPAGGRDSGRVLPFRRWGLAVAGVAAALVVLLAVVLRPAADPTSYPVAGTAVEPAATAQLVLDPKPGGVALTMTIAGLPPSAADTYYAAWLRGPAGVVPVGSFHWRKGGEPIELWSGVDSTRYPDFFVTRQREGAPPSPSTDVVLEGRLS